MSWSFHHSATMGSFTSSHTFSSLCFGVCVSSGPCRARSAPFAHTRWFSTPGRQAAPRWLGSKVVTLTPDFPSRSPSWSWAWCCRGPTSMVTCAARWGARPVWRTWLPTTLGSSSSNRWAQIKEVDSAVGVWSPDACRVLDWQALSKEEPS